MISSTKSNVVRTSEKTWAKYSVVFDGINPVGVTKKIENARIKAAELAREKRAGKVEGKDVWIYEDSDGTHVITIVLVDKIKVLR